MQLMKISSLVRFAPAVLLVVAGLGPAAAATTKSATVAGNVAPACNLANKTSFPLSIVVLQTTGANRSGKLTFDGTVGTTIISGTNTVTNTYSFVCNIDTGTLTVTAPLTNQIVSSRYAYTVVVKQGATTLATANSGNSATFPRTPTTGTNYTVSLTISAPANNFQTGTYTATVTIQ